MGVRIRVELPYGKVEKKCKSFHPVIQRWEITHFQKKTSRLKILRKIVLDQTEQKIEKPKKNVWFFKFITIKFESFFSISKVPQDSGKLRKDIYFCPSCNKYLTSAEFPLASNSKYDKILFCFHNYGFIVLPLSFYNSFKTFVKSWKYFYFRVKGQKL